MLAVTAVSWSTTRCGEMPAMQAVVDPAQPWRVKLPWELVVGSYLSVVLRTQLRPTLSPDLWQHSERILTELEAGRTVAAVPPELAVLYRPGVQPFLISVFRHRPAEDLARLRVPVLIAQGTTDVQVAVEEAHALHLARPDAELVVIDGMNHVLKAVPAGWAEQLASYSDPALPVVSELIDRIGRFIRTVPRLADGSR
jgi:pimeloyl-ACP methyl ester carboxylesterase